MASASHVTIRKRIVVFLLIGSLVMAGLMTRLVYLQFYRSSWLTENALDQRIRDIPVEAKRGIIYDRLGRELAISVSAESVYAIPAEIRNPEETAAILAAILNLDRNKLTVKLISIAKTKLKKVKKEKWQYNAKIVQFYSNIL